MPSATSPPRRRPREDDSDSDAESLRASQRSTPSASSSKRARTNGYRSDDGSPAPEMNGGLTNGHGIHYEDDGDNGVSAGPDAYQPGALVRVKLTNFVTYESAEFCPGPNLNMVIGPNGTGKSTLVCAICLGLGWGPTHLGRASQIGEFVKHGLSEAQIEIELQKRPTEAHNHVVRLKIIRDGNGREWHLDNKKVSLKAVQALMASYSIQVDNLCQFLPQDKVSEFALLTPVELLHHTQRAAAPPEMLEMHERLKRYRKEQKAHDIQLEKDKEQLLGLENRQQSLQSEVDRLNERNAILKQIKILNFKKPFVEYSLSLEDHKKFKAKKVEAQAKYEQLKTTVEPTLASIERKKSYARGIEAAVKHRKAALTLAERAADGKMKAIQDLEAEIQDLERDCDAALTDCKGKRRDMQDVRGKISRLKAKLEGEPVVFNAAEYNERVRAKDIEIRDAKNEAQDASDRYEELRGKIVVAKENEATTQQELESLDTQEGRLKGKLEKISPQIAKAWKWVQENPDKLEKEVFGPPLLTCSIKDPRYTRAVEAALGKNDFLAITAQTSGDFKLLSDQFHGLMGLSDVVIRTADDNLASKARLFSVEVMQGIGMDGYALDYIEGPPVVLCMLCNAQGIDKAVVTLNEPSDAQYNKIMEINKLTKWSTATQSYRVFRRAEYGDSAVSTSSQALKSAFWWVDQPVDTSARTQLQQRLLSLKEEINSIQAMAKPLRDKRKEVAEVIRSAEDEIKQIKDEKNELQRLYSSWRAIPDKIQTEEATLRGKQEAIEQANSQIRNMKNKQDLAATRRCKYAIEYKDLIEKIRNCHDELLEAQIRLIEAHSDVQALTARNEDIVQELEAEEARKNHAEQEAKKFQAIAKAALAKCKEILNDPANKEDEDAYTRMEEGMTIEILDADIAAEESKLEFMHANNPNAIRDFETRQVIVDRLKEKIEGAEAKLETLGRKISQVRGRWEPQLDKLISEISDAFACNFEEIGCAGSVSVRKDDDFDDWAIEIKVKFRKNEELQILDSHRQSGGERSVSTIFYLMSLQALARAPFRVVDEINQGMDPRNERMVHERMVEIACKEHTSQYFLITPKLLTGLRYDKRMKVLCIASGEHMPDDYKKLDMANILGIQRAIMVESVH